MDDAALVARARAGDTTAFGALVERHQARVLRLVRGIVGERDAEDVAQETFLKAWRRLPDFDGRSRLYTWLFRIAANTAMDWRKRERYRRHGDLPASEDGEDLLAEGGGTGVGGREPASGPQSAADRRELAAAIDRAIADLPDRHREIVVLREVEGLSYEEIAVVLGVSKGTVESRLFRAREKLREALADWVKP